jgi:hypothetical protein
MKRSITLACAFAFACTAFVALPAGEASAQTATNLKCKGCVGKKDLGKKVVRSKNIKPGAVGNEAIADGAIDAAKLADGAKPAGAAETIDEGGSILIDGETVTVSVAITAPADGVALVTGGGFFRFTDAGAAAVGCQVTAGTLFDDDQATGSTGDSADENQLSAVSQSRVLVAAKGINTYNFVCATEGIGVNLENPTITALFVPAAL